jgi:hypothetical protein
MNYETAKELFDYNPDTGVLTWKVRPSKSTKAGNVAGSMDGKGYRSVQFKGKNYKVHRIAWILTFGAWPEHQIDHINGIPDDNRLVNLREATQGENNQNTKARSNTGVTGITLLNTGYYQAHLTVNGKRVLDTNLKNFDDAVAAMTSAKREHHKFHSEIVTR